MCWQNISGIEQVEGLGTLKTAVPPTPTLPHEGGGSIRAFLLKSSPLMGEGWVGVKPEATNPCYSENSPSTQQFKQLLILEQSLQQTFHSVLGF